MLERIGTYMAQYQVQPGASFPASARAAEMIAESHRAMAAMINASPEEVMIGPSTTMNVFLLAQALRPDFREGDEIVVTNLDHEANVGAWRRLAAAGVRVREWRFDADSMALEPEGLAALLNERTRAVCFGHCSNITGGFTDVPALVRTIHDAGALACVDGVAYAAHRLVDVKAWDVDFYLCSTYKLYGPHLALLYGKRAHMERAAPLNHCFLDDALPLKLNPGGPNHELSAGLAGITAYLDALHAHHEGETNRPLQGRLAAVFERVAAHEEALGAPLLDFLASKRGVRLFGCPQRRPQAARAHLLLRGGGTGRRGHRPCGRYPQRRHPRRRLLCRPLHRGLGPRRPGRCYPRQHGPLQHGGRGRAPDLRPRRGDLLAGISHQGHGLRRAGRARSVARDARGASRGTRAERRAGRARSVARDARGAQMRPRAATDGKRPPARSTQRPGPWCGAPHQAPAPGSRHAARERTVHGRRKQERRAHVAGVGIGDGRRLPHGIPRRPAESRQLNKCCRIPLSA